MFTEYACDTTAGSHAESAINAELMWSHESASGLFDFMFALVICHMGVVFVCSTLSASLYYAVGDLQCLCHLAVIL